MQLPAVQDIQSPKLFSSDNNMDPWSVPVQQQMHDQINCKKSPTGSLPPAVPLAITRTFRPWTHTSDDSYIYQLSLVVGTATVSFLLLRFFFFFSFCCMFVVLPVASPPEPIGAHDSDSTVRPG